jgi:hypothetical protein
MESTTRSTPEESVGGGGVAEASHVYGAWKELYHKELKRVYYRNTSTGESTWKIPPEVRDIKDRMVTASVQSPRTTTSNAASPASPSSPPAASASASRGAVALRVSGAWKELLDPATQRKYYVNAETKQRTWKIADTPFATQPQP